MVRAWLERRGRWSDHRACLRTCRSGNKVYVGGEFVNAGGIPAADIVPKWNGTAWSALGPAGTLDTRVNALVVVSGGLIVGGQFTDAAGIAAADNVVKRRLGGPRKPDGRIRLGTTGSFEGNDVYNTHRCQPGTDRLGGERRDDHRRDLRPERRTDQLGQLQCQGHGSRHEPLHRQVFQGRHGHHRGRRRRDVHDTVVAARWQVPRHAKVTVTSIEAAGSSVTGLVTIRSVDDPGKRDVVNLTGKRA